MINLEKNSIKLKQQLSKINDSTLIGASLCWIHFLKWREKKKKKKQLFSLNKQSSGRPQKLKTIEPKELFKDDAAQMPEIEKKLKVK